MKKTKVKKKIKNEIEIPSQSVLIEALGIAVQGLLRVQVLATSKGLTFGPRVTELAICDTFQQLHQKLSK